tara:strand:- start:72 stop:266 length:195 start_codon:yes stop_codon:yes gene_type:complete
MAVYNSSSAAYGGGDNQNTIQRMLSGHRVEQRLHQKFNIVIALMLIIVLLQGGLLMVGCCGKKR